MLKVLYTVLLFRDVYVLAVLTAIMVEVFRKVASAWFRAITTVVIPTPGPTGFSMVPPVRLYVMPPAGWLLMEI